VDVRIDAVDGLEIAFEQYVSLDLLGQDGDDFCQSTLACPIVGKWMFGTDSKDIGCRWVGIWDL
jgi:hypothetical protein